VLVFDIWADYGHFKKYFANMSPLSFSIPPRTVIAGILGALIGIDKTVNPETFNKNKAFIALKINNEIKKTKMAINNIKADSKKELGGLFKLHKPTNYEFLKDCSYRLFVALHDEDLYRKLKSNLENHSTYYTLNMGISACIANFKYVGEYPIRQIPHDNKRVEIDTIIPSECVDQIDFDRPIELQKAKLPNQMKNNREVTEYREFIYDVKGQSIPLTYNENSEIYALNIKSKDYFIHPM